MKKTYFISAAILVFSVFFSSCAIRVRTPVPEARVVVRSAPPGPRHIWVADEYVYRGGRYVLVPGYWAEPHRSHLTYIPGHWKVGRKGSVWIRGRWR